MSSNQFKQIKLIKNSNSVQLVGQIINNWVHQTYRVQKNNNIQTTRNHASQQKQQNQKIKSNIQPFEHQQYIKLKQMVNVEPVLLQKRHLIKFSLANIIQKIPVVLIQKMIFYMILKKLMWTMTSEQISINCKYSLQQNSTNKEKQIQISDKLNNLVYSLSKQIKQIYQFIYLKDCEYWKEKFNFDLLCILMTRIITKFIEENIKEILIQKKLMNEIYIIIIHVFLGIDVSSQTYSIIAKKFVKKQNDKIKTSKIIKLKQTESIQLYSRKFLGHEGNLNTQSQNYKKMAQSNLSNSQIKKSGNSTSQSKLKRLFTKNSYQQNSNFKKIKHDILFNQICESNNKKQFLSDLKQNLHVDPLPLVVKKKMNINQIDKKQQIMNQKDFKDFDFQDKKRFMKSNQLSQSMSVYLKKYGRSFNIRSSQVDPIKNECRNSYLPIKGINLKMKTQKSSGYYYLSHNNSFQKKENLKNHRQLQSERLSSQKNKEKSINTQKISIQKKRKNVKQWYKIIDQLKQTGQNTSLNHYLHKIYNKKQQTSQDFPTITKQYKTIELKQVQINQQQKKNLSHEAPNQVQANNLLINTRMSEARTSLNIESILKYASDLKNQGPKQKNKNYLQASSSKDYSSLQPRINQNEYKQNVQNRKIDSYGLKKNLLIFSQNCKRRNQYIVSSIFKKNNLHSYN